MKRIFTLMLALVALAAGAQKYIPMLDTTNVWKIYTLNEPNEPYIYEGGGGKIPPYDVERDVEAEYTSEWVLRKLPKEDVLFYNGKDMSDYEGHNYQFPYRFEDYDSVMILDTSKEEVYKVRNNPQDPDFGKESFIGALILTEKERKVYLSVQDYPVQNHRANLPIVHNFLIYDFDVEEGDIVTVANAAMLADNINHSRSSYYNYLDWDDRWKSKYDVFYNHSELVDGPPLECLLYRCWSPTRFPASCGDFISVKKNTDAPGYIYRVDGIYDEMQVNLYCAKIEEHFIAGKNRRCFYFIRTDRPPRRLNNVKPFYRLLRKYNSYICWIEGIGSVAGIMFNVNSQVNKIGKYSGIIDPNEPYPWVPTFDTIKEGDKYTRCELVEFNGEPVQLDLITGFKEDWQRIITACSINPALQEIEGMDDSIYDLSGRRLREEPASGIYIRNGKKYIKR